MEVVGIYYSHEKFIYQFLDTLTCHGYLKWERFDRIEDGRNKRMKRL